MPEGGFEVPKKAANDNFEMSEELRHRFDELRELTLAGHRLLERNHTVFEDAHVDKTLAQNLFNRLLNTCTEGDLLCDEGRAKPNDYDVMARAVEISTRLKMVMTEIGETFPNAFPE